jgi:hypothetical protein
MKGLETAYMRLAMSGQRDWTDEHKLGFEQFVAEIQLYGTPKQIELTIELIRAFIAKQPRISFDPLLENLRDSLREELRMEKVRGSVWWYRFTLPEWLKPADGSSPTSPAVSSDDVSKPVPRDA